MVIIAQQCDALNTAELTLKMVKAENFMLCIFCLNEKIGGRGEKFWALFRCRTYTVSNVIGKSEINQLLV